MALIQQVVDGSDLSGPVRDAPCATPVGDGQNTIVTDIIT